MTLKIKRSDLEKLSKEELLSLASHTQKLKEAAKQKSQEVYLAKAHPAQIEFHKNTSRVICFLGGNRCVRGDQKILTKEGPKAIRDIEENDLVLSYDHEANQFQYSRSSASILKGRARLYRVTHEKGEFVAHERHLVFCPSHTYQFVGDLNIGQGIFYSAPQSLDALLETFDRPYPIMFASDEQHLRQKLADLKGDYSGYTHQYGQQPTQIAVLQECERPQGGAEVSLQSSLQSEASWRPESCGQQGPLHIHPDLSKILSYTEQNPCLEVSAQAADPLLDKSTQHIEFSAQGSDLSQNLSSCRHTTQRSDLPPLVSRILSVSILPSEEDYYDIQVPDLNNYVLEDGTVHANSGKTTAGINELIWTNLGTHPFRKNKTPIKSAVVLQDYENHCKNIFEPKLIEWAPPNSYKVDRNQSGAIRRIIWNNGSTTDIFSHDQDKKVYEGSDYQRIWFDEPPPAWLFKAMWRGLTDHGGTAVITATPLMDPWLYNEYKRFKAGEQSLYWFKFVSSYENAKNIGEGDEAVGKTRLDQFADLLDPEERAARLGGEFMQAQGMVFSGWDRNIHLIKPFQWPHDWPIIESIDPHPRKPAGVSWVGLAPNGAKILISSGYLEGDVIELGDEILRRREMLDIKDERKPRITRCLIDNASNAPLTGKSLMNMTRERVSYREELEGVIGPKGAKGPRIECPPKDVAGKIAALRAWLTVRERDERQRPDFFVFDTPENEDFIAEIEGYVWARYKSRNFGDYKDQPIKKNDDILDSVLQVALTLKAHDEKEAEVGRIFKTGNTYSGRPHSRRD